MKTETYEMTILARADHDEVAVYVVETLETEGKNIAAKNVRNHFSSDFEAGYVLSGARKISAAKAKKMVAAGAVDLRMPTVATASNRRALGALVGM